MPQQRGTVVADLPDKPRGFFKLVGPGAVLVGLAIGAGELVVWPVMTARFGAGVAWAAVLGILLQLVINIEIGRYTLATGQSIYSAFARLGRGWVPVFLALNVFGWILPGWARACAGALKALVVGPEGPGQPWQWTAVTFVAVGLVMFGPPRCLPLAGTHHPDPDRHHVRRPGHHRRQHR